jgi:hypothetical protein
MNQTFTIQELTLNEVNAILASIQELPAKVANPLTEKIRAQAMAQVAKFEAEAKAQAEAPNVGPLN